MAEEKKSQRTQIIVLVIVLFAVIIGLNFFYPMLKPVPLPNQTVNGQYQIPINNQPDEPIIPNEPLPPIEEPQEPEPVLVQTCAEQSGTICSDSENCSGTILPSSDSLTCCSASCISVDSIKPSVSIIFPENQDQVSGYFVEVKATASDNVEVVRVDFLIDGDFNTSLTAKPYTFIWDARMEAKGNHALNVKAFDAAGNFGLTSITVNLK
ncbi:MAG: Ig-like domain-containing protein [archaeon]|nr:Ig-like domain-containing protein [archaeon]